MSDKIIINRQLELSGTRVKYLDDEKRAYKHDIWSYRVSEKPLTIAYSGVSRETRCLKVVYWVFFNLHTLLMREAKALVRSCVHAGLSEPSPHADAIRTIISCADQFLILIFHCGPIFYFLIQYYNLNSSIFETLSERIYLE